MLGPDGAAGFPPMTPGRRTLVEVDRMGELGPMGFRVVDTLPVPPPAPAQRANASRPGRPRCSSMTGRVVR